MTHAVTIKDVAEYSGFSLKTVSRVINGVDSVAPNIREKVEQAIQTLGYRPNPTARSLRAKHSFTLGLVYDEPKSEIQKGALGECKKSGFALQIHPCDRTEENYIEEIVANVRQFQIAGLILTPPFSDDTRLLSTLQKAAIPFVRIISSSTRPSEDIPCVFIDDRKAGAEITKHIMSMGHRRIGFIWGDSAHKSSHERYRGFVEAHADAGIDIDPDLVVDGRYSFESGVTNGRLLMSLKDKPTAIICCNDDIAAGAVVGVKTLGLAVPSDVAIAGFEDNHFARQSWPPLTTVRQETERIAATAAHNLIKSLHRERTKPMATEDLQTGFQTELIIRESTNHRLPNGSPQ